MSIFQSYRDRETEKKLEELLARAGQEDDADGPVDLTVEEAGMLYGFIHSSNEVGTVTPGEKALIADVQRLLGRWRETRSEESPRRLGAEEPRTQVLLRCAITKLRLHNFSDLTKQELDLTRGALVGLRQCREKGPRTERLITLLSEVLGDYDRLAAKKQRTQEPVERGFASRVARDPWVAILLLVLMFFFGGVAVHAGLDNEEPDDQEKLVRRVAAGAAVVPAESGLRTVHRTRKTDREKAIETIRAHRARIDEDPSSEDAPALLAAIGNLNLQKVGDYEEAARNYELLLLDYPDWQNNRNVYLQLATCYEKLSDPARIRRIYTKIMNEFPEESQEYQYAQARLRGDVLPIQ